MIRDLKTVVGVVPEGKSGEVEVRYIEISEDAAKLNNMRAAFSGQGISGQVRPGTFAQLIVGGQLMMSDTFGELYSNLHALQNSHGHGLVAGLGLGILTRAMCERDEVDSITVIEKDPDVVALVADHVHHPKLKVIQADIFEWKPPKGTKYDFLWFDIWPTKCVDSLAEIARLHNKFKSYRNRENPKSWMESWEEDFLRSVRRRDRAFGGY